MAQPHTLYNRNAKVPRAISAAVKILEATAPKLAIKFAIRLFTTPVKHKLPKREIQMDLKSTQHRVFIKPLGQTITVYVLGESTKKVLLLHGWSGRGTQLCSIADRLVEKGYSTISFDAPAHGKSTGKRSDMTEFITCAIQLQQEFGPFEFAIGHSLGAMALLNAIKRGLTVHRAVIIGSGDIVKDIMDSFWQKLGMNVATGTGMIKRFEKKVGETINNYSAYIAAQDVKIPVLVLHDEDDEDVPVSAAYHIARHLKMLHLLLLKGLGTEKYWVIKP
ncbi:alpha/beta hydrolase [Flavobacterium sp. RHBU_24]|uniref:alpha/beta hydrolase n=1 Tax=Flavobacterium sp. RHBU_24 TaxID=3391185 RepID=UPI00398521A2